MKKLFIGIALLSSLPVFSSTRAEKSCIGDVEQFSPVKEYIAAQEVIDTKTGLVKSFQISTTFASYDHCKSYIDGPIRMNFSSYAKSDFKTPKLKCYATDKANGIYHLVKEYRSPKTGLVAGLDVVNVFDNLASCASNLF